MKKLQEPSEITLGLRALVEFSADQNCSEGEKAIINGLFFKRKAVSIPCLPVVSQYSLHWCNNFTPIFQERFFLEGITSQAAEECKLSLIWKTSQVQEHWHEAHPAKSIWNFQQNIPKLRL